MNKIILLLVALISLGSTIYAQSDVKMRADYGTDNQDLISILYFEQMGFHKITFTGKDLIGKDFIITMKEYSKGKLAKQEVVFDSKEAEQFKIKTDKFMFRVVTRITSKNTAKFQFQFNGFNKTKEYSAIGKSDDYALKDFLGSKREIAFPISKSTYILTYMMPYINERGWGEYCDVAQSGVNPEEFGIKYAIPQYFLFDIKFQ